MPRLRQVSRSEATEPVVLESYDRLFGDRDPVAQPGTRTGTPGNWWTVFAISPDILKHAVRGFQLYASAERSLSPRLRELGQTRAGWVVGSQFVFSQHCKACRSAGLSDEQIEAIPAWQTAGCFSAEERAVLAYADALASGGGRVPDALFAALREHLSEEAILELTYITSMYVMHAIISRALRLEYDDRDEAIVEVPAPAEGGPIDLSADLAGSGR